MAKLDPNRRVVVTGLGVVSSLGIGWEEFWKNLLAGKSGISRVEAFDTSGCNRHYAGEIKNFDPSEYINKAKQQGLGRASQMAIVASHLAIKDSQIILDEQIRSNAVVCVGTTTGEIGLVEKIDDDYFTRLDNQNHEQKMAVLPASFLSISIAKEFGLKGNNLVFGTACSSGNYAISTGFDLIKSGAAHYALVGGSDGISRIVFTGFDRLLAIAPEKCQPFDLNREGMIPGEGSGILFLETLASAKKRKAKIYAEIVGYGMSCDGHNMTAPDPAGVEKAISKALSSSGINPEEVDYISAHGTGTPENDRAECTAINRVFGKLNNKIPVSSIKSMLGHTMGAAAALESIACCLAIEHDEIPPTINFENQDPFCDIDCVANRSRKLRVDIALNNSQAFGGNNSLVVIGKHEK